MSHPNPSLPFHSLNAFCLLVNYSSRLHLISTFLLQFYIFWYSHFCCNWIWLQHVLIHNRLQSCHKTKSSSHLSHHAHPMRYHATNNFHRNFQSLQPWFSCYFLQSLPFLAILNPASSIWHIVLAQLQPLVEYAFVTSPQIRTITCVHLTHANLEMSVIVWAINSVQWHHVQHLVEFFVLLRESAQKEKVSLLVFSPLTPFALVQL